MPLETSAQSPAPVRQIANLVAQYVDRLGVVWVCLLYTSDAADE